MTKYAKSQKSIQKTSSSRTPWLIAGGVIVGALILGYLLISNLQGDRGIEGVTQVSGLSRDHDNTVTYEGDLPPVGGEHFDVWQTCGVYDEPVLPGYAIHSMEHGAVWITYDPALTDNDIAELQDKVRSGTYLLLSPFPGQKSSVVVSAWGVQLELDSATDKRLDEFIDRYRQGPTTPERGAACTDGVGVPLT